MKVLPQRARGSRRLLCVLYGEGFTAEGAEFAERSEERRGGKECAAMGRSRGAPYQ